MQMGEGLVAFFGAVALTLGALLPIVNPPGSAPVFLSMTSGASQETRIRLARRVSLNSLLLLLAAALVGSYVLSFFGLSIAVVKIAGGLLVIASGWALVTSRGGADAGDVMRRPSWDAAEIVSVGFYPLTFPLTVGPGSVSVALTLGAGTRGAYPLVAVLGVVVGIAVVAVAIYLAYRYAWRMMQALGDTGSTVFLRLSAFILLAIGVQIFCDGLAERFAVFR
jgi:multiple antibiotic resistance protein